jgi:hypothetical protein
MHRGGGQQESAFGILRALLQILHVDDSMHAVWSGMRRHLCN